MLTQEKQKGELFIPSSNARIKQRLLIAAHAGAAGHRSATTAKEIQLGGVKDSETFIN